MPEGFGSRALKNLKSPLPKSVSKFTGVDEAIRFQTRIERQQKRTRRSVGITSGPDFPSPEPQAIPSPKPTAVNLRGVSDEFRRRQSRRRGFASTILTRGRIGRARTTKTTALGA